MFKRLVFFLLLSMLSFVVLDVCAAGADPAYTPPSSPVYAPSKPEPTYGEAVAEKLGSAAANLVLSPLEIPKNIINTTNDAGLALGLTGGVAKGFLHMAGRFLSGTVDLVSFPLPTEPLTNPRYVWQGYAVETRYNPLFKLKK